MKNTYLYIIFSFLFFFGAFSNNAVVAQEKNNRFQNNQDRFEMVVYPMPAKTELNIRLTPKLLKSTKEISIVNLIGREVSHQRISDDHQYNDVKFFNLQQFPNGIYMVIAKDEFGNILHTSKLCIEN